MDADHFGCLAYEFAEVSARLHKLQEFISRSDVYAKLDATQKDQLLRQRTSMQGYTGILLERIEYELE